MTSMPDVAPTLMMIAPFLSGATRITGLATLRVKECDRIAAPDARAAQARRRSRRGPGLHGDPATGCACQRPRPKVVEIETYHDHRIAMSFGVLGSRLPGLRILDPGCVAKTYPNYWRDWQRARDVPRAQLNPRPRPDNFPACVCAASVPKSCCCVSCWSGRRRSCSGAARPAAGACAATRLFHRPRSPGQRPLRPRHRSLHAAGHEIARGGNPVRARQPDAPARRSGPRHRHPHRAGRQSRGRRSASRPPSRSASTT